MKKSQILMIITFTIACAALIIVLFSGLKNPLEGTQLNVGYSDDTVEAEILEILEEGEITLGEITQPYQIASIQILEGEFENGVYEIDHGKRQIRPEGFLMHEGDHILVTVGQAPDGTVRVYFVDYIRRLPLLLLGLVFVVTSILVSGWKGVRSLISIGISILVVFSFIIPNILRGNDPVLISIIGAFIFLAVTQYLVYGWTLKTHIAMAGILIAITITGLLSVLFVNVSYLSGFGDENAMYLMQQSANIDIKNLLVAGIIIGSLGVLDDLVIGQTSSVIEIYLANPNLSFVQRFRASMNIGRDHVAATVNTLVLAYLGASMSMFLLFSINQVDMMQLVNVNFIAEEIVRSLVGTVGLFLAVPITTAIACWVVDKPERLEKMTEWLGSLTDEYGK